MSRQLLVAGAGIAGASLAYQAAQRGWRVTVVDPQNGEGASQVPAALLNPVRGQGGRVAPRALAGLARSWALIAEVQAAYAVAHGRSGVLRPVPDQAHYEAWRAHLPAELSRWLRPQEAGLGPQWYRALEVSQGGWVDGGGLVRALLQASGSTLLKGRVQGWGARQVTLCGGQSIRADAVVNCTGAAGAVRGEGVHRAGSLLLIQGAPERPISYGAYLSPAAAGGVLGATFEAPQRSEADARALGVPAASMRWLLEKGEALGNWSEVTGYWSGVRLSGIPLAQPDAAGVYHLRGLGSKGFLLGPLLASELLETLTATTTP